MFIYFDCQLELKALPSQICTTMNKPVINTDKNDVKEMRILLRKDKTIH